MRMKFETSFRTRGRVRSGAHNGSCRSPNQMQMFGPGFWVGHAESAAVLQRRHRLARGLDFRRIDLGHENGGLGAALGAHLAPGSDDQRMSIGLAFVLMHPTLRRSEHEAAILDG